MKHYKVYLGWSCYSTYGNNEKEARANFRKWLGVKRLPNGTCFSCETFDTKLITSKEQMELFDGV